MCSEKDYLLLFFVELVGCIIGVTFVNRFYKFLYLLTIYVWWFDYVFYFWRVCGVDIRWLLPWVNS